MRPPALAVPPSLAVAGFDSASAMLRALGRFLHGRDFALMGLGPSGAEPLARAAVAAVERLPDRHLQHLYSVGGWSEAVLPFLLGRVHAHRLADWVTAQYPERRYPAVMVGASNGAGLHLAAALGIPWLPQTLLVPVAQSGHADDPSADLRAGRGPGRRLLDANPDLQLHHMHDPNQDRLMIRGMTYFRVKLRQLPDAYRRFVEERLEPGGTILVVDCGLRWPTTTVGDRHLFQHGAFGGMDAEDYRARWGGPEPDGSAPEAEWGYETALDDDLVELGRSYRLRWLRFEAPGDLSPVVAELHRQWHARLDRPTYRLLAESFIAVEPYWAQRTASVPYWLPFSIARSFTELDEWLVRQQPFDEIRVTLFPHGVASHGVATPEDWRTVLGRATKLGTLLGVSEDRFPRDFGALLRYHHELSRVRHRHPLPASLGLAEAEALLGEGGRFELADAPRAQTHTAR